MKRVSALLVLPLLLASSACRERETLRGGTAAADASSRASGAEPGETPSLILVSIDTLRSDHLSVYGHSAPTPAFERLAEDGVLFERAYTSAPLTLPAHASILTGLEPPDHGVRDNLGYRLENVPTIAQKLVDAGYATGAAVSAYVLRGDTGIGTGFETWDDGIDATPGTPLGELDRPGETTVRRALEWLDRAPRPFFLFLHLFEPHSPYDPPPGLAARFSPYEGEVIEADRILGLLLAALDERGLYDDAALVVLSDHGEGLGDHGEEEHGILLHRETVQIPLLVKLPRGRDAGTRVSTAVGSIDVAPTLLELAGISPGELPGRSLLSTLRGDGPPARVLYAETYHPRLRYGWSELLSAIRGPLHLIQGPEPELYDLERDPGETENVLLDHRRQYRDLRDALSARARPPDEPFEEDSETRDALATLGYLGGGAGGGEGDLPDPKSRIRHVARFQEGLRALESGRYELAESILEPAVAENPQWIDAWQFLGLVRNRQGKTSEAFDAYRRAFDLSGGSPLLARPLARLALELNRPEDGLAFLRLAVDHEPDDPGLRRLLARTLLLMGRGDEALEPARVAVDLAPGDGESHYLLGAAHTARGDLDEAETHLRRALEISPRFEAARNDLKVILTAQGRFEEAEALDRG